MVIHTVLPGETAASVAAAYGVNADILAFDNDITGLSSLPQGMSLAVPQPETSHTVEPGETLFSVARRYGTTENALWRNNLFLNGGTEIYPGQTLYITLRREPLGGFRTGGYAYPYISGALLGRSLPCLSAVTPFTYGFTPEGALVPPEDGFMLESAKRYGAETVMHLSSLTENDVFSTELAEALLNDPVLQEKLLDSVIANITVKGYDALDVDFEFLGAGNARKYADFINYCVSRLHPLGIGVMTALAPKTYDSQPGLLYEGHDYALLGEAADAVLLMTYEWGYTYGPPMAVSPIIPLSAVVDYALTRIPAGKILLGVSVYGYDFTLPFVAGESKAVSLSTRQAVSLAAGRGAEIKYDTAANAPYFDYYENGVKHTVWYEDARSIDARLRLMAEKGLSGAMIWNLDREGTQNLVVLNGLIDPRNFDLFQGSASTPQIR
ncbi:MAG: LysM peptidoglycan-binding domain-containing protein [Clostridia bacterium]|nr:LysM peptidoglycan-binding domain-containing protein [Clostridia bacterium]